LRESRSGRENFDVVAVCDQREEVAARIGAELGVPYSTSIEAFLTTPGMAAVGLFTRPWGRAELLGQVLASGRHVMTTKPFELDPRAARRALDTARHLGLALHLNSPSPQWTRDLRMIDAWRNVHDLGQLVFIRGEVWASYQESEDGSWMDEPGMCPGGPMIRLGVYLINDIVRLAGSPSRVRLCTARLRTGRPTPDNALLDFEFPGGALGSIYSSFCVRDGDPYANALALHFERGSIYRNVAGSRAAEWRDTAQLRLVRQDPGGDRLVEDAFVEETSGAYLWEDFASDIRAGRTIAEKSAADIVAGVRVLDQMRTQAVALASSQSAPDSDGPARRMTACQLAEV
jgi:predicted dehydrogenase